jgi:hypothetical protein
MDGRKKTSSSADGDGSRGLTIFPQKLNRRQVIGGLSQSGAPIGQKMAWIQAKWLTDEAALDGPAAPCPAVTKMYITTIAPRLEMARTALLVLLFSFSSGYFLGD